jgi:hypothetical protein
MILKEKSPLPQKLQQGGTISSGAKSIHSQNY